MSLFKDRLDKESREYEMGLRMIEWQQEKETILDYVRLHPGCMIQDITEGTGYTCTRIIGVVDDMVEDKQLERWYSYPDVRRTFYIPGTHIPTPIAEHQNPTITEIETKIGRLHVRIFRLRNDLRDIDRELTDIYKGVQELEDTVV